MTMRLSGTVMEIWPFEVLPGRLFQEQKSVVGRSVGPQYYTDLIYSFSLRQERSARGVKNLGFQNVISLSLTLATPRNKF